jgi:hypothetical protein
MFGIIFIAAASAFVTLGSYLISTISIPIKSFVISGDLIFQLMPVLIGVFLNLFGSLFWIIGRKNMGNYSYSWILYLSLLVIFGVILSVSVEKENFTSSQFAGIIAILFGISLISK